MSLLQSACLSFRVRPVSLLCIPLYRFQGFRFLLRCFGDVLSVFLGAPGSCSFLSCRLDGRVLPTGSRRGKRCSRTFLFSQNLQKAIQLYSSSACKPFESLRSAEPVTRPSSFSSDFLSSSRKSSRAFWLSMWITFQLFQFVHYRSSAYFGH